MKEIAHFFGVLFLLSAYHYKKEADVMKSKNELYQEIEKWYKKQARIISLKYALPDFFQRLVQNVKG